MKNDLESTNQGGFWQSESFYFGTQEVVSFLFLFLSPLLGDRVVQEGWYSLGFWRVAALSALLLTGPRVAASFSKRDVKQRFFLLGRGLLYGLPFWISSLLFPLRSGQAAVVGQSLVIYLLLSVVMLQFAGLSRHWLPALLGCLTLAWFGRFWDRGPLDLIVLSPVALMFWTFEGARSDRDFVPLARVGSLLGSGAWAFCLFLFTVGQTFGLENVARAILVWLLLVGTATVFLGRAQAEHQNRPCHREAELAVPGLAGALGWLNSRRLMRFFGPWIMLALIFAVSKDTWQMSVATCLALPGMIGLAGRPTLVQSHLHWWCSFQFLVLWGIAETDGRGQSAWILVQALFSLYLFVSRGGTELDQDLSLCPAQGRLEEVLPQALTLKAPPYFLKETLRHIEPSVDIDASLSSEAPKGFRERLLERLRQADPDESVDDA